METNILSQTNLDIAGAIWTAILPYVIRLAPPTIGIMVIIGGVKIFLHPIIRKLSATIVSMIYRSLALALGVTWMYAAPALVGGKDFGHIWNVIFGLLFGFANIWIYDKWVAPWLAKRKQKK